ncbi:MAG TPA: C13 family peptidase [Rhizomicrobium sp.]|nr:C13 family peptidase [Rhizomicrobium sp.]
MSISFSGRRTSNSPPLSPENEWQRYGRWLLWILAGGVLASVFAFGSAYARAATYSGWAVVVVAGDWHAHDGSPSEIFDNARRDVSAALAGIGFNPSNIVQFSVRPARYPAARPFHADSGSIAHRLWNLSDRTHGGCLLYFSSHGAPSGLVLGESILTPVRLDNMVSNACEDRPTIVVISACYSGVFLRALEAPNRMILTAARPDRTSFGCGATNKYPYFDECFLSSIDESSDFRGLALRTRQCVAKTERATGMSPPSEPQIFMGSTIAAHLPAWR